MELDLLPDDGPIHDVTSAVAWDDGILWQGTYFGLSRYDGRRWKSFVAEKSGLSSNFINYIDARGKNAWIATDLGLCVTNGDEWMTYRRGEEGHGVAERRIGGKTVLRTMTTALPHDEVLGLSLNEDEIWIATSAGLARGRFAGPRK